MKKRLNNDRGFTLVELVVIVVILVILATMAIPLFNNFFTKKYSEKSIEEAQSIMDCSQIAIYELYASNAHNLVNGTDGNTKEVCFIEGLQDMSKDYKKHPTTFQISNANNLDIDIHLNPLSKKILELSGMSINEDSPCIVFIATGKYDIYCDPNNDEYDPIKAYTVYQVIYQPVFKRKVFFLDINGDVSYSNPYRYTHKIHVGDEDIVIQYYALKCGKDNNNAMSGMWGYINATYN